MLRQVKKMMPHSWKQNILSVFNSIELAMVGLCARSAWLASLYYLVWSRSFGREHKSVLAGRLEYKKSLLKVGKSSALLRRNIHRLEKGIIMRPRRLLFAQDYILETVRIYQVAKQQGSVCELEMKWATDVLTHYFSIVNESPLITEARNLFSLSQEKELVSSAEFSIPYSHSQLPEPSVGFEQLTLLYQRRRSVRWFSDKEIDSALIRQAVTIASLAPSACNRQPYRFDFLPARDDAADVARCAMGTAGFADNIPALIVIVGDLSCYPAERDRHVIYIDASLAAMQLMLALETLGLSSCPINWPDIEDRETMLQKKLQLADYERPVMLLAVGYADPDSGIAFSQKKTDELLLREVRDVYRS